MNMTRQGKVFNFHHFAGIIKETNEGKYIFTYNEEYLAIKNAVPSVLIF
ncbi:hypothetical protein [Silvanigrella aquatica]|nr:hypothetical protein [Silvanigrella aquatica]